MEMMIRCKNGAWRRVPLPLDPGALPDEVRVREPGGPWRAETVPPSGPQRERWLRELRERGL